MHARVATFEGADVETQKAVIENIRAQSASGPPEGVPATEFLFLSDGAGKAYAIMLFESEADSFGHRLGQQALLAKGDRGVLYSQKSLERNQA